MAEYELWMNGEKADEIWFNGEEYTEVWTAVNGEPTLVWKKGGGVTGFIVWKYDCAYIINNDSHTMRRISHFDDSAGIHFLGFSIDQQYIMQNDESEDRYKIYYTDLNGEYKGWGWARLDSIFMWALDNGKLPFYPLGDKGEFMHDRYAFSIDFDTSFLPKEYSREVAYNPYNPVTYEDETTIFPYIPYNLEQDDIYMVKTGNSGAFLYKANDVDYLKNLGRTAVDTLPFVVAFGRSVCLNDGCFFITSGGYSYLLKKDMETFIHLQSGRYVLYYDFQNGGYIVFDAPTQMVYRSDGDNLLVRAETIVDTTKLLIIPKSDGGTTVNLTLFQALFNYHNYPMYSIEKKSRIDGTCCFEYIEGTKYYMVVMDNIKGEITENCKAYLIE